MPVETSRRAGDALGAMYVLAALFMFIVLVVLVALIFVPPDLFSRSGSGEVYVPGAGPAFTPMGAAVAIGSPPGVREVAPNRYEAVIEAHNWVFIPNEIRVPAGAEVTFRARSVQDYHGIALVGTEMMLSLGQNQIAEGTHTFAEPGEYLFVCSEYCGAGHLAMMGKVVVE